MTVRLCSLKTTFSKMIVSYLMVLVVPLIFGVSLYATTLGITRRNVEEANLSVLNNVRDSVNISLSGISSMMRALLSDGNITALSSKDQYAAEDYKAMDEIQSTLSMSLLSNAYIDDILIYFHKADFILSSKSYLSRLGSMSGYSSTVGLDVTDFAQQIGSADAYSLRLVDSNHGTAAFITAPGTSISGKNNVVSVLVRLKTSLLEEMIVSDDCRTFLVDASGHTFSGEAGVRLSGEGGAWTLERKRGTAENSRCIETEDTVFQIRYVRFVPAEIYYRSFSTVCLLFFAFLALCLGGGLPLAVSTARRSYHPVREILSLIPQPGDDQDSDDYMVIRSSLTGLLQKTEDYEVERDNRALALRSYLLFRLLNPSDLQEADFLEVCRKCEITFENTSFLLIGFSVENGSNLFFQQNESVDEGVSNFLVVAITNVLRTAFTGDYKFFTAAYKGVYYAVVNVNSRLDKEVVLDEIKKSCLLAAGRLDADFRAIVSIAVSNVHTGYLKIRRCYEEVEAVLWQQNALKHSAYVTQHRELALIKQKAEAGASPRAAALNPKKDGKKWVNVEEIKAYIDSHYTAPDLTVGALSDRFHMTAANLSLLFKRKLGVSPLEYIQIKRVSEAKCLLEATQMKVSDIAKSVGYYDSRPLIRAFRRIEGVNPAEYRDQKKNM